jgi:hypothetical protein
MKCDTAGESVQPLKVVPTRLWRWNRQSVPKWWHLNSTPGNNPKENIRHLKHSESLKSRMVQSSSYTCHKCKWSLQLIFHWQYAGTVNPSIQDSFYIKLLSSRQQLLLYKTTAYWIGNMSSCLSIKHIAMCKATKIKTQCSNNSYPGTLRQLDEMFILWRHYINCGSY